jgi:hypothetical protein
LRLALETSTGCRRRLSRIALDKIAKGDRSVF